MTTPARASMASSRQSHTTVPAPVEPDGEGFFTPRMAEQLRHIIQEDLRSAFLLSHVATSPGAVEVSVPSTPATLITTSLPAVPVSSPSSTAVYDSTFPVPDKWATRILSCMLSSRSYYLILVLLLPQLPVLRDPPSPLLCSSM